MSGGKKIQLEEFCRSPSPAMPAAVIFLHGSGGPDSANLPYVVEEQDLAKQGYCIYVPHFLDSTGGRADNTGI
jgi:dienelactone hydrolase